MGRERFGRLGLTRTAVMRDQESCLAADGADRSRQPSRFPSALNVRVAQGLLGMLKLPLELLQASVCAKTLSVQLGSQKGGPVASQLELDLSTQLATDVLSAAVIAVDAGDEERRHA
jgi:hypothetical protein